MEQILTPTLMIKMPVQLFREVPPLMNSENSSRTKGPTRERQLSCTEARCRIRSPKRSHPSSNNRANCSSGQTLAISRSFLAMPTSPKKERVM